MVHPLLWAVRKSDATFWWSPGVGLVMRIDSSKASTAGELRNLEDLARLYEVEYQSLLMVAQLATGSPQLAEEAVHEAFITVYNRRDSIEQPGAYLRRVVLNNCYSMHRGRTLERKKIEVIGHRASDEICLPPELDEVWQSLARLNYRQRTALVLRYYEDLTLQGVADAMGVRLGTAKSLIHRGLKRLEEEVER